jgi:hypothetical protein
MSESGTGFTSQFTTNLICQLANMKPSFDKLDSDSLLDRSMAELQLKTEAHDKARH